jgi:hypothetical protein
MHSFVQIIISVRVIRMCLTTYKPVSLDFDITEGTEVNV